MYSALLVSKVPGIQKSIQTFVPRINPEISVNIETDPSDAIAYLKSNPTDAIVCEHSRDLDAFSFYEDLCRDPSIICPFILVTDSRDIRNAVRAFDERIDYFVYRGESMMDFCMELSQKIILASERRHSEQNRSTSMKRLNTVMTLIDLRDHAFSEVLNYALESSVELTGSEIGYVATYSARERKLRIISWSIKAMGQCKMMNRPMEYDLDSSGLWGEPVRLMKSIIVDDYEHETVYRKNKIPMGHVPLKNLLMIPIIRNGIPVATAGVGNKNGKYTDDDEVQFRLLIDSLISIYYENMTQKENQKNEEITSELLRANPNGLILLGRGLEIRACNDPARRILSLSDATVFGGKLSDADNEAARSVCGTVTDAFRDKCEKSTYIQSESDGLKGNFYVSANLSPGPDGEPISALVVLTNVTKISEIGVSSKTMNNKIRTLSAAINSIITEFRNKVDKNNGVVSEADWQKLNEICDYTEIQKNVASAPPVWQRLDSCVPAEYRGLTIDRDLGPISVLADPCFKYVFQALFDHSIKLGATVADVYVYQTNGKLKIAYTDNGSGISHSSKMLMFSGRINIGLWTLMVSDIVRASGFSIEETGSYGHSMMVEIEVPPASYSIGAPGPR